MDSMQKNFLLKTNTKFGYLLGITNIFYPKNYYLCHMRMFGWRVLE